MKVLQLIGTLSFIALLGLLPAEAVAQKKKTKADFSIDIQKAGDELHLTCTKGCTWNKLQLTLEDGGQTRFIDKNGLLLTTTITPDSNDPSDFIFSFEKEGNKIFCQSVNGTHWDKLSFNCQGGASDCSATLNQDGVSVNKPTMK